MDRRRLTPAGWSASNGPAGDSLGVLGVLGGETLTACCKPAMPHRHRTHRAAERSQTARVLYRERYSDAPASAEEYFVRARTGYALMP